MIAYLQKELCQKEIEINNLIQENKELKKKLEKKK